MYEKEIQLKIDKSNGYEYFIDCSHPLASGNSGRVYYHRHVKSLELGRWITPSEIVHHLDENRANNNITNLVVMSAKEHGLLHATILKKVTSCHICGSTIEDTKDRKFCSIKCRAKSQVTLDGLSKEELEPLIWIKPFTALAKQFNCSDNGIRKWAKRLSCDMPPPMFHNKNYSEEQKLEMYRSRQKSS